MFYLLLLLELFLFFVLFFLFLVIPILPSSNTYFFLFLHLASTNRYSLVGCASRFYGQTYYICCGSRLLYRLYGANTRCCGRTIYNSARQQCCNSRRVIYKGQSCNPCRRLFYFSRHQICCGQNALHRRAYGSFSKCCGNSQYDSRTQKCCPLGKVVLRAASCNQQTCGARQYNPNSFICCNGNLLYKRWRQFSRCCGNIIYSPHLYTCCKGKFVVSRVTPCSTCGRASYNRKKQICCNNVLRPRIYSHYTVCCASNIINGASHKCCNNGHINSKFVSCTTCGRSYFNPTTQICCGTTVRQKIHGKNTGCCGVGTFNTATQRCCGNFSITKSFSCKPCNGVLYYDPLTSICCRTRVQARTHGQKTGCCATQTYDTATQKCCNNRDVTFIRNSCKKCGNAFYNPTFYICCKNMLRQRTHGANTACCKSIPFNRLSQKCCPSGAITLQKHACQPCGVTFYDPSTKICCGNSLRQRTHAAKTACCQNRIYNRQTHQCCPTGIVTLRNNSCTTCNGLFYNAATEKCCNDRAVVEKRFSCSPCSNVSYDPYTSICCGGRVLSRSAGATTRCCGISAFNPTTQICCANTVRVRIHNVNTGCCRNNVYNTETEQCCPNGTVTLKVNSCTTCGKTFYNPQFQKCCNGQTVVNKNFSCVPCGRAYFDPNINLCCLDRLHNLTHKQTQHAAEWKFSTLVSINVVVVTTLYLELTPVFLVEQHLTTPTKRSVVGKIMCA